MRPARRRLALVAAVAAVELFVVVGPGRSAPATAAAAGSVGAGSAIAEAGVAGVSPIQGGTTLSVSIGEATSSYQANDATASSQTVNLGGIGVILANSTFCGTTDLPTSDQPKALTSDSTTSPGAKTQGSAEAADATASPERASATTQPAGLSLPGLLDLGGTATSSVAYATGSERTASSRAVLDLSLAGGVVALDGLEWQASQETGRTASASASFSIRSLAVAGKALPTVTPPELASAVGVANQALALFGLKLTMPAVERTASTGAIEVTPLQLALSKSTLSTALVDPLTQKFSTVEQAINGQVAQGADCSSSPKVLLGNVADTAETVGGLAAGIFSSSGGLLLDLGGASADTAKPPDYTNPFGGAPAAGVPTPAPAAPTSPPATAGSTTTGGSGTTTASTPGGSGSAGVATAPATPAATGTATTAPVSPRPVQLTSTPVRCESTSPAGGPSCSAGTATLVGAIAAGAGVVLLAADIVYGRRRRRRLPLGGRP